MATATVSASVDADVKRIVNRRLRELGTTPNKVIRDLWEHIALSGEVPSYARDQHAPSPGEPDSFRRLMQLRSAVPASSPLADMDTQALRRELEARDA